MMMSLIAGVNGLIGSLLMTVKPMLELCDRFQRRQDDLERWSERIGTRYYDIVVTVKHMLFEAKRVRDVDLDPLYQVNVLLHIFNQQAMETLNTNCPSDIHVADVRKKFGNSAAECILKMNDLFFELDKEGKEVDRCQMVCSGNVISLCRAILRQWDALVAIMARKRFMRSKMLAQEFHEKAEGL